MAVSSSVLSTRCIHIDKEVVARLEEGFVVSEVEGKDSRLLPGFCGKALDDCACR